MKVKNKLDHMLVLTSGIVLQPGEIKEISNDLSEIVKYAVDSGLVEIVEEVKQPEEQPAEQPQQQPKKRK
ncbi:MAG: hypothetical protein QXW35_05870 [Candidatus Aenigmatarchaeota archaeon]